MHPKELIGDWKKYLVVFLFLVLTIGSVSGVYVKTNDINLASLLDGDFPDNENEIAIDRMHADNAGIKVGDKVKIGGQDFKVTGFITYINYSTLHEKKDLISYTIPLKRTV